MSWHEVLRTRASGWVVLIRLMVDLTVFIQKLIFPEILGAGRFTRIGMPLPHVMGPFVGVVEIVCGALIIVGLLTRLAAIPPIITMIVAIVSTKIPILLGHEFWIFHLPKFDRYGFWSASHESRADLAGRLSIPADRGRGSVVDRCSSVRSSGVKDAAYEYLMHTVELEQC
jgi:putative oxidoreductase